MAATTPQLRSTSKALLVAGSLGMAAGCDRPAQRGEEPIETIDDVSDEPRSFLGERVTLAGEVDDIHGRRVFELQDDIDLVFEDSVLVLTRSPVQFGGSPLANGDDVVVEGTVRRFVTAEVERELGWDFDQEIEIEDWEREPVLVADSVRRMTEAGRWSEDEPEGIRVGVASVMLDPDPEDLAGTPLTLERVLVRRARGKTAWVGTALAPVFVVAEKEVEHLEGRWADVLGTVRPAPSVAAAVTNWDLDQEMVEGLQEIDFYLEASLMEKSQNPPEEPPTGIMDPVDYEVFSTDRAEHVGRQVEGRAEVTKVFSDRAFYLSSPIGTDVLAVVREDVPQKEMIDIDAGQRLEFQARVLSTDDAVAGRLEGAAKAAIAAEPAFLAMVWPNVSILEAGNQ